MSAEKLIEKLGCASGKQFEEAVAEAFNALGFDIEVIKETQAESDIIVKGSKAIKPYYTVVECTAVREGSEVSYHKLGQIRGNYVKYVHIYGKRFSSSYTMIVGRPSFSQESKDLAEGIGLLTVDDLARLLQAHEEFSFTQDELEVIFKKGGQVEVESLLRPYYRKLDLYVLIYLSLLRDPLSDKPERKFGWTPMERLIGSIQNTAWILKLGEFDENEILNAARDLCNPFVKVLEINDQMVVLTSFPLDKVTENMGKLGSRFRGKLFEYIGRIKHIRQ